MTISPRITVSRIRILTRIGGDSSKAATPVPSWSWLGPRSGAILLLVAYAILIRAWGVSESFWLLGDQVRDWTIASGPWRDLPLGGVPSNAGGTTLGPIYYWVLWLIVRLVGPWTGGLPHAGGIGLAIVQAVADG